MAGNIWEWCFDWYGSYNGQDDPAGPASGSGRVLRGGAWSISSSYCRVAARSYNNPTSANLHNGFRCVRR